MGNFFRFLFSYGEVIENENSDDSKDDEILYMSSSYTLDKALDKILVHVSLSTLKMCRLVNRHWRDIATEELTHRDTCLTFHQNATRPRFYTIDTKKKLKDLNKELLAEDFKLYCTHFEFHGNMSLGEVQKFFIKYGHHIRILVVKNLINYFTRWSVLSNLLKSARNVEDLTVLGNNFDFDVSSTADNVDLMIVPLDNLKICRLNHETTESTLYKVIMGSENLERIVNFDFRHLDTFLKTDRKWLIKKMTLTYPRNEGEVIENKCRIVASQYLILDLVTPNPLEFHPEDRWCNGAILNELFKILAMAQDSLEHLTIFPLGWLKDDPTKFPIFSTLKHLQIIVDKSQPHPIQIFPPIVHNLKETLPQLEVMTLSFYNYERDFWSNSFPKGTQFRSVKTVQVNQLDGPLDDLTFALQDMKELFPNVKNLWFGAKHQSCDLLSLIFKIWDGAKLKSMEFEGIDLPSNSFEVDSILTGIDQQDCAHLFQTLKNGQQSDEQVDEVVLKYLRSEKPSIRNLPGLENFRIVFKMKNNKMATPVSIVSYRYAFSLMVGLKVTIDKI